jgi:putative methionine-R-sulfoxide reductase with GAF domain
MIKINLIMKEFLKGSIDFVGSILNNDSNNVLLKNTCLILDCERTSLFILDKISDMLIVHSGEGLKKGQIKIPKDKGIVGSCFMSKKKLKIDEVYFDNRFDKEIDKKTNFRTRNILCYPLIDNDNECFGVIEAINKNNSKAFDPDDEELLKFFSLYASAILKNAINADENSNQISRVELILNYALEMQKIQKIFEFLNKTKDLLYNLFSCVYAQIFLCENDEIYKYNENGEKKYYNKNLGYIGIAYKNKKIYECSSTQNSIYYNDLIDMESANGLLTFPIIYNEFFKGIIQVPYHSKPNNDGKPRSNEVHIIKLFSRAFIEWYNIHDIII